MDELWEMIARTTLSPHTTLTCEECSVVLAYLIDLIDTGDVEADLGLPWRAVQRHLARCPECREDHTLLIGELEDCLVEHSLHVCRREPPARAAEITGSLVVSTR